MKEVELTTHSTVLGEAKSAIERHNLYRQVSSSQESSVCVYFLFIFCFLILCFRKHKMK